MIDVSIIIVNWNTKQHLLNCLNSLSNSDSYTQEIIVVDNASCDGSVGAVTSRFPTIKVIESKENVGFAKANNIGIRQSTGRFLCLFNGRILPHDFLEYYVHFFPDALHA